MNVTKKGGLSTGPKTKGVEYLSDEEAFKFLRENSISPISSYGGKVIAASKYAITEEEKVLIGEQVVQVGENMGKKLSELPDLYAAALSSSLVLKDKTNNGRN